MRLSLLTMRLLMLSLAISLNFKFLKFLYMKISKQLFITSFPHATQCASCRFFRSDVTLEELEELYEDFVKDNICLFADGYAFPCQYRSIRPPIDKGSAWHLSKRRSGDDLPF